ncbi:PTS sugar transporter subunit IIB [Bacillus sp. JJ1764]|uniref:PTS sugar transporter subunit IIB n=1 Tax=Bacillus sp. JJ1764 TaxID=3122964 RepID=UPI002FFE7AC1
MNILLCCSVAMSTSLLVSKMKKSASERSIECHIWAVPIDVVKREICTADVLLLGPQVRYMLPDFKELCDKKGIPVDVIDIVHYGIFNGKEVLDSAIKLIESSKRG